MEKKKKIFVRDGKKKKNFCKGWKKKKKFFFTRNSSGDKTPSLFLSNSVKTS